MNGYIDNVDVEIKCDTLAHFVYSLRDALIEGINKEGKKFFKKNFGFGLYVEHIGAILRVLRWTTEYVIDHPYEVEYLNENIWRILDSAMYDIRDDDGFRAYEFYYTAQDEAQGYIMIGPVKLYINFWIGENQEFNKIELDTDSLFDDGIRLEIKDEDELDIWDKIDLCRNFVVQHFVEKCGLEEEDLRNAFPNQEPFDALMKWIEDRFEVIEYSIYLFKSAEYELERYEKGEYDIID